ncbi:MULTISPECIES: L,D-transpeptidase [unclassified Chelatococcus]|uniref:L,D-transpeptidase family protein n=1 Tax=unclassified Chelatococcus TaxID=2638111 RepID=UPI001BCD8FBD|nr:MULTISPECIES: L,D-transpeptidase [unclassified Chelatococcus]CAH1650748.1 Lipoprotein-anchoring transpeptidase ErfK/SrfK [Hyphomicrobiales bacterium]MBS7743265.1 murein L,D-transpeptidase [Chelatococcus sp. HY11]MBX3541617.1 murein L,D-transpeptidase [Chelatococcus sp.]MCO5074491.1 L,D-transpeptidase [Chelatococcus sp.]CAH1692836.1 Lipoprotein-anchoring transpeptidase ErfK/SrfK [Hyphomicrobiales bacterium]
MAMRLSAALVLICGTVLHGAPALAAPEAGTDRAQAVGVDAPPADKPKTTAAISDPLPTTREEWVAVTRAATFPRALPKQSQVSPAIVKLQIMLDRVHASPGVIDGHLGSNVAKAISAFQTMRNLPVNGVLNQAIWDILERETPEPPLMAYAIAVEDVAGPFVPDMPKDYGALATRYRLAYRNPVELLAEKFHMDEDLLRRLNPGATFETPGETIVVADVRQKKARAKVAKLVADKSTKQLLGYSATGELVVAYPATIGSRDLPSPTGVHLIGAIAVNPEYWYRPAVNFQQGDNTKALRIAPGPNNPVGSVWIGLDKPTYGIHGTPEPSRIDKTNSHGCIRLTNWDVEELVKLVQPGVPVEFLDGVEVTSSIR